MSVRPVNDMISIVPVKTGVSAELVIRSEVAADQVPVCVEDLVLGLLEDDASLVDDDEVTVECGVGCIVSVTDAKHDASAGSLRPSGMRWRFALYLLNIANQNYIHKN